MDKRVLVTGVNGFAGHYLAPVLVECSYEVFGASNTAADLPEVHQTDLVDLRDAAAVARIVEDIAPTHIVHLAAVTFVAHDDIGEIYATNIVGTRNLLQAATRLKKAPQAILLTSSANIYGNNAHNPLSEDDDVQPLNDYAVSKVAMEYMARQFADRLNLIVARPFNYTGIGQGQQFLVPKIVSHFRDRAPLIELGNTNVARDYSDVRDVVRYMLALLETPMAIGGTFNICSGQSYSLASIIAICEQLTGHRMEVRVNPDLVRRNDIANLVGNSARLHATVGRRDEQTMESTLRWMLNT